MKRERFFYIVSIICLSLFPCTFLLMPFAVGATDSFRGPAVVLTGMMFWITGIGGYVCLILVYVAERACKSEKKRFLFSNALTAAADVMFGIGIVVLAVLFRKGLTTLYSAYVCVFVIVFSWNLHWLFSRNFQKKLLRTGRKEGGKK